VTSRAQSRSANSGAAAAGAAVSVADLLALPALAGARPVPADAALGVPVRAVVLADPDASPEPGSVVLSPGGPPAPLPEGCVAVVCREAPAAPLPVPCLVLPAGAGWAAVIADVAWAIAEGGPAASAARARSALRAPLLEGRGYAALAAEARDLLGAPVACLDDHLDLLGAAGLSEAQESALDDAVTRSRGHGPASVLGSFLHEALEGVTRVPVTSPAGPSGAVVAWVEDPSAAESAALAELAEACAVEHAREEARTETEARLRGDLVEELLANEVVSRESLVRRARHLGADLSRGAVALIGKLQDPHTEGRLITDPRLVRRFLQQARAALDLHWPRSLVDWNAGHLLVLLPPGARAAEEGAQDVEAQALTLAKRLLGATRQTVPGLALTMALSRYTREPERLGAALDEAQLALSIGERLGRVGEVVTFEETGTYKLLFQIFAENPGELTSFYESTLASLVRYDEQYSTELVLTLSTYLENDCNLAATAGTLYTHRHTVRYRLDRIAELSGLDIARTDDREKLSLGLKAMRLLGRRVSGPPGERPTRGRSAG
jgi:PucR family transcriptional regulator, purine catabolism regulatory protein